MITFLDTSSLLQLYFDETGSEDVRTLLEAEAEMAVSATAYVEAHSAFARRHRAGLVKTNEMNRMIRAFEADWFTFGKVRIDEAVLRRAGKLCLKHGIRSLDAIQLSAATFLSETQDEPLVFLTADKTLQAAARKEKLQITV